MRATRIVGILAALAGLGLGLSAAADAASHEPFYKGKTIRIVVGYAAGGGFDTYSRMIGRHLGKHVPGNPSVIVENMPGAGGLITANHLYNLAKPDGLTVGHFLGGLLMGQILGQRGIEFDARKFDYVASPARAFPVCAFTKQSGIASFEDWANAKTPPKLGGVAVGASSPDNTIRILRAALGIPVHLVTGYKGTANIRLAAEGGELAGSCWPWTSVRATWRKGIESGEVKVVLQTSPNPHPELAKVPVALGLAKTDEGRKLIQVGILDDGVAFYQYALPPGTPKDRVQILRKGFMDALKSPELLAEAEKIKLDVDPVSGEEIEKIVAGLFALEPAMVAKLKDILLSQ
jgi:tripartite-type tricarboxylate transporter receptor subunit TctC